MNYNQAGQAANVAPKDMPALDSMQSRVNGIAERVGALRERLGRFVDRVGGSEPQKDGSGAHPRPVANGTINGLNMALEDLAIMIEDCHAVSVRIERIG